MAYLQESLFTVSLFLLVPLCSGDGGVTFSLNDKIEEYAYMFAKKHHNYVTWLDSTGKHPKLQKDYPRYQKYKVTTAATSMKFSQPRHESVRIIKIFSQKFSNGLPNLSKVTINRKIEHHRVASWNSEHSFSHEQEYFIKFTMPENVQSIGVSYKNSETEKSGSGQTTTDVEEFVIGKNLTILPGTSLRVTWTIKEYIEVLLWKAKVTSRGWFAVYYYYTLLGKYLVFHPVCRIKDAALESNCSTEGEDGGYVKFNTSGKFTGVKNTQIDLTIKETTLESYKGKRLETGITVCR